MTALAPHAHLLHNPKFRFRDKEIDQIHYCWSDGQSVLLTGIRRTGKSEVLKAALWRYAQAGQAIAHLDVQDQNNLAKFYQDLLKAVLSHLPVAVSEQLKQALTRVANLPNAVSHWLRGQIRSVGIPAVLEVELTPTAPEDAQVLRYWPTLSEHITIVLASHPPEALPVIGLDELPFMLENLLHAGVSAAELTLMLASLRKLRDAGLRFIIAGSISFENLLSLHGIPHTVLGGLARQNIPPFSREEARQYLAEKLRGRPAAEHLAPILDGLPDYVPEFLRIAEPYLFSCKDANTCRHALSNDILPAIRRAFLQQFDERLNKNYLPGELPTAHAILDRIAQADAAGAAIDGRALPEDYQRVLLKLQYDNFLIEGEGFNWCFSLNLIRQWWRGQRGMA